VSSISVQNDAIASSGAGAPWWRAAQPRVAETSLTEGSRIAFRALVAFTVILLLSPQIWFPFLAGLRIAFLAAGVAIAAHVVDRTFRQRPVMPVSTEIGIALALVAWSVVTIPLSYWPGGSVDVLTDHYLKAIAFFWLLGTVLTSQDRVRHFAWTLVACSVPLAFTGMHNYVSGMFLHTGVPDLKRIYGYAGGSGLVGNPNDLALMLNLIIPITGAIALGARRTRARWAAIATLVLCAVTVILTFSRAGFLTLVTTFLMFLVVLARRKSPGAAAALMLVALIVPPLLPEGYMDRLSTITNIATDKTGSAQGRWEDLRLAGEVIIGNPLIGVGIGQDVLALRDERGTGWTSVHNAYLQYAVDLGIPGFLLFVWLHVSCFRSARAVERRAAKDETLRDLEQLGQGVQISLIAFAVAAFFHPIAYQFYFFTIGGLAIALKHACRNEIGQARLNAQRTS
jgi:probable O-glycosylation ligase (exosortase A-associated)